MFWLEYKTIHHEQIESKIKALMDLFTFYNTPKKKKKKTHVLN